MRTEKKTGVTLLLNFLLPGVGHLYASNGESGVGILIANIVCGLLTPFLYLPIFVCLVLWIVAMAQSGSVTAKWNRYFDSMHEAEVFEKEERAERQTREARRAELENQNRITGHMLSRELSKLEALLATGLLDEDEAQKQKQQVLSRALDKWTDEDLPTFLSPFGTLVAEGALSKEEVSRVKMIHGSIARLE